MIGPKSQKVEFKPGPGAQPRPSRKPTWRMILWARFQTWNEGRKFRRNEALFKALVVDPRSGLERTCRMHAERMAVTMVMQDLDRRGVMHCKFCHVSATLRRIGSAYLCPRHEILGQNMRVGNVPPKTEVKGGT